MSLYEAFETDQSKEEKGVRVEYTPNPDGTIPTFVIRSTGKANIKYAKALDRAIKPYRSNLGAMGNALAEKIMANVFIDTVLVTWENVQDKKGNPIEFNKDNALQLFCNTLPRLFDDLQEKAKGVDLFKSESLEDDAKN